MRRLGLLVCALLMLAPAAADAGTGGTTPGGGSGPRLQGTWTMHGKITRSDNVRGERKGQKVKRRWSFTPSCSSGPCSTVTLRRERSSKQFDKLTLTRSGSTYAGSGKFYVRLKCNGKTYNRGGIAYYSVKVRVTRSATVQGQEFATRVSASYSNSKRVNKTPCAGSIGRDGGTYSGKHAAPAAPTADFDFSATATAVQFTDKSSAGKGSRLISWTWDFGDGSAKSSKRNPSHTYATPGSYDVTLTIRDSNGITTTVTKTVTV